MKLNLYTQFSVVKRGGCHYVKDSGEESCYFDVTHVTKGREYVSVRKLMEKFECTINFYEMFFPTLLADGYIEIQEDIMGLIDFCEEIKPQLSESDQKKMDLAIHQALKNT